MVKVNGKNQKYKIEIVPHIARYGGVKIGKQRNCKSQGHRRKVRR